MKVTTLLFLASFILFFANLSFSTDQINIGTNPIGAFFHTIGVAAAKVINEKTNLKAIVKPMSGPEAWMPYMARGEIQLGVMNMWDAEMAVLGKYEWEKLSQGKGFPNLRILTPTVPNKIGIVVPKDSPVRKIADLKGKKVAGKYPRTSITLQTLALLANGGLEEKDVIMVPVHSPPDGVKAVIEGRADASGTITLGSPVIEELNAKKGARYLPLDPSPHLVERMKKYFPGYMAKVKEGPGTVGISGEQYLWVYDIYLATTAELPDSVAYTIVKALYENYKEFELVHKLLKDWDQDVFVSKDIVIPYHPGVVKYFKEKGLWTKEMEEIQSRLIAQLKR
ncbi:MAG: TAXI family TRAP transporter solute-binding subunit [Desulfobacterota bacterium]|nr:TAXI family TRAP transporter solute-binding subunit [Thermodesulfobacteriota bacterium]MDW8001887.1 TAXI family TRAP transporter solute-binding subunit [Deltaproteobacteria bacterium]